MGKRLRIGFAAGIVVIVLIVVVAGLLRFTIGRSGIAGTQVTPTPTGQSDAIASGLINGLPTAVAAQPTLTPVATATPLPTATTPPTVPPTAIPRPPTATTKPRPPTPPTATPVVGGPTQPLPPAIGIHTNGNQIINANGQAIRLIGTNFSHFEYSCYAYHMNVSDFQIMRSWGLNTVRMTVSSEYWNHCAGYRNALVGAITNAEAAGLYVIITLQWTAPFDQPQDRTGGGSQYPMPDNAQDVGFWTDIANLYKQDTRVLFDLMGEPHDVDFNTWFNGGSISVQATGGFPFYSTSGTYQAIGMKGLAQVIRNTGANNIIVVSGTNYGYTLSQVSQGYAIPVGNVIYGTHPFDWPNKQAGNWDYDFGNLSAQYPVTLTEFGEYDCQTHYITQIIPYANSKNISWLSWNWGVGSCASPNILADWNGTPSNGYGDYLKAASLAIYHP